MTFPVGDMRFFATSTFFRKKKPAGSSFHVLVMQAHARMDLVSEANHEKMLGKVLCVLEDVSPYRRSNILPYKAQVCMHVGTGRDGHLAAKGVF